MTAKELIQKLLELPVDIEKAEVKILEGGIIAVVVNKDDSSAVYYIQ
jgi:hypothetical protein